MNEMNEVNDGRLGGKIENVSWKPLMRVPGNAIMIVNDSLDIQARD